jgi:hypothetical protein
VRAAGTGGLRRSLLPAPLLLWQHTGHAPGRHKTDAWYQNTRKTKHAFTPAHTRRPEASESTRGSARLRTGPLTWPGPFQGSPGTVAHLWVTFLSPPALRRMHETEGGYHCVRLPRPAAFLLPDGDMGGGRGAAWPAEEELLVYVCGYRRAGRQLRAAVDAT